MSNDETKMQHQRRVITRIRLVFASKGEHFLVSLLKL